MAFYFSEKEGDKLMSKINLRDVSSRAKQWDHPIKGLFKYVESMKANGCDIFKLPKKDRESYCVSIVTLALMNETKEDWWMNMPKIDPPDGLVMTLKEEKPSSYMGHLREVEIVEHRNKPEEIFETIRDKMVENQYEPNTILVCLVLVKAISVYDFKSLSLELAKVKSTIKHVFVVFTGVLMTDNIPTKDQLQNSYTMVQLLPILTHETLDLKPHLNDFTERYNKGKESRIIEDDSIYFGTSNKNAIRVM